MAGFQPDAFQPDAFATSQPAFQPGAFQATAFQTTQTPVPPVPPAPSTPSGGGGWVRHFDAGETRYTYGNATRDERRASDAPRDRRTSDQDDAAKYARQTVAEMLRAVDAAQAALDARARTEEIARLLELQIARDEEEAVILILALA